MGCRGHFGPQAEFSGWNTAHIVSKILCEFDVYSNPNFWKIHVNFV